MGGTSADWQLSESVTWDSADFTSASFAATDSNMNGGVNQSSPIYSYVMPLAGGYDANGDLLTASDSVMGQWTYSYDSAGAKPESLRRETTQGPVDATIRERRHAANPDTAMELWLCSYQADRGAGACSAAGRGERVLCRDCEWVDAEVISSQPCCRRCHG